jgi:hypothetical protein
MNALFVSMTDFILRKNAIRFTSATVGKERSKKCGNTVSENKNP